MVLNLFHDMPLPLIFLLSVLKQFYLIMFTKPKSLPLFELDDFPKENYLPDTFPQNSNNSGFLNDTNKRKKKRFKTADELGLTL